MVQSSTLSVFLVVIAGEPAEDGGGGGNQALQGSKKARLARSLPGGSLTARESILALFLFNEKGIGEQGCKDIRVRQVWAQWEESTEQHSNFGTKIEPAGLVVPAHPR